MTACILVVDDEPDIRELVALTITRMGLDCHTAANLEEAGNLLNHYSFDACLTDMRLPDGNGVDFVRAVKSSVPDLPVAVITAHGNMEAAVEAMKNGAFDFVSKPVDIEQLRKLVITAVASHRKVAANEPKASGKPAKASVTTEQSQPARTTQVIDAAPTAFAGTEKMIGNSAAMLELKTMILKLARTNAPVWISGESGTGKELTARLIHENSARASSAFVPINCGAIPAELIESELFGHKKGSFTGAVADHDGLFQQADGGTLFLDEIAELPLAMQVKLLRVLQEKTIRPVGSSTEIPVDVRILSASHKDLGTEVEAGHFRHDLYYRLNVITLRCPSLKERSDDIQTLARHILESLSPDKQSVLTDDALNALGTYSFPGNVRELENIIERTLAITDGPTIDAKDLQLDSDCIAVNPDNTDNTNKPIANSLGNASTNNQRDSRETIVAVLEANRWNRKAAAKELGLTYRQLRYRIEQLGIDKN